MTDLTPIQDRQKIRASVYARALFKRGYDTRDSKAIRERMAEDKVSTKFTYGAVRKVLSQERIARTGEKRPHYNV